VWYPVVDVRIEEVIGLRIRHARKLHPSRDPLSQAALGKKMEEYLGVEWSRQAVSYAEKGRRDFKAAELAALALALRVPLVTLIEPPEGSTVELAEGRAIPSGAVNHFLGFRSSTHDTDTLISKLFQIRDEVENTLVAFGMDVRHDEDKRTIDKLIDKLVDRAAHEDAHG
jgi:transcriptional regulator with XRE-family HTH domain